MLESTFGEEFTVSPFFGHTMQTIPVIPDLQSDVTWVAESSCIACYYKRKYDMTDVTDATKTTQTSTLTGLIPQDSYSVTADIYTNSISMHVNNGGGYSLTDFTYGMATASTYKTMMANGALGLSRASYAGKTKSIVYQFLQKQYIKNAMVSFYFNYYTAVGNISFGGQPASLVGNPSNIMYDNAVGDTWAITIKGLKAGKANKKNLIWTGALTTKNDYLVVPKALYDSILSETPCGKKKCEVITPDYSQFPTLTFTTDSGNELVIPPQNYVAIAPIREGTYLATLKVFYTSNSKPTSGALGLPLFKSYYTMLNYENDKVGFYPLNDQFPPTVVIDQKNYFVGLTAGGILLVFSIFLMVILAQSHSKQIRRS
eukprot:TRINITY_DN1477_c0_g1_i1.p1 TRINITY_DN1477_c0_g1~~TRINITY_DN1477_c0_g1_i1.p1  ORF type:complete len:372 (-),score=55.12 TRINITY_DN1477_c0_g1_i1:26-1141(-)